MNKLILPAPDPARRQQVIEAEPLVHAAPGPDDAKQAALAGLWLLADDLDRAHRICQDVPSVLGSAWHAVVHRRDGDFANSLYWWRQVERGGGLQWINQATHQSLGDEVATRLAESPLPEAADWRAQINRSGYNPADFVRRVQADHRVATGPWLDLLQSVQRLEWMALFTQCWQQAAGSV